MNTAWTPEWVTVCGKKKRKIELCTKVTEEEKWKLALRPREESKIHLMGCASGYDLWV